MIKMVNQTKEKKTVHKMNLVSTTLLTLGNREYVVPNSKIWGVTRDVKLRFDKEGVSIPFPQRDVHVYHAGEISPATV